MTEGKKIDLTDVTFIIPVCIESDDRYRNAKSVLGYLNHHFNTNVIIHEVFLEGSKLDFLNSLENLKIKHIQQKSKLEYYHRTRQLNEMLDTVETPVVSNYDIDVILPVQSYISSRDLIVNKAADIIYPYGEGEYQKMVPTDFDRINFDVRFEESQLVDFDKWSAKCGHCFFADTKKYRLIGGENENFIAYGPEDAERYHRFSKLGLKVSRINDWVYHFEHSRTPFSSSANSFFDKNHNLYNEIVKLSEFDLAEYYKAVEYRRKYKNFS